MTARWVHRPCRRGVGTGPSTPARSLQEWCTERARSVQGAYKNGAWSCKEHARGAQGVCKEQRAWTELAWSMQGVCNKRASRPPEPQTKQRCHRSMCTRRTAGWGRGRDGQDRQTPFLRAQEQACRRAHSLHQQGTEIGGKKVNKLIKKNKIWLFWQPQRSWSEIPTCPTGHGAGVQGQVK